LFCARLPICLLFLWLIKTAYCIFPSVETTKNERKKQLAASPTHSALRTLYFRFISFQLQDLQEIKDAIGRAAVNGALFYRITARPRKRRYFLLKVFRSKRLYKIMVLSIVCLMIVISFVFLSTQGRATKLYDEYRQSVLTYVHTYIHI